MTHYLGELYYVINGQHFNHKKQVLPQPMPVYRTL